MFICGHLATLVAPAGFCALSGLGELYLRHRNRKITSQWATGLSVHSLHDSRRQISVCVCYWHVLRSERKVVNWNTEMKRASTLQWCLVVSGPLSCFTCWPWSISCNCFICTPHMSLSGVWGSYRLQSITKLSRWSQWQSNEDHIVLSILHNCDIVMSSQEADPVRAIFGGGSNVETLACWFNVNENGEWLCHLEDIA